ncbi:MAG: hypothetical protein AB1489_10135 [Acidobacteriota bacterium]
MLQKVSSHKLDNDLLEVEVKLAAQDKSFIGQSCGKDEAEAYLRLSVEATLNAIVQALVRPIKFSLSSVLIKELAEHKQRVVVVLLRTDYFIEPVGEAIELLGACKIANSEEEAAVRATLNATNRAIALLLR